MKILYDYQAFHLQRFGGISKYFVELLRYQDEENANIVAVTWSMNQYLKEIEGVKCNFLPKRVFKIAEGLCRKANRNCSRHALENQSFDLIHPTYYHPYFLEMIGNKPFVLTIHDMTHERLPAYFSTDDPTIAYKRMLAERATRIIAISESTKRDIIEILGIDEAKIDVIYHGIEPRPLVTGRPEGLPEKYILFVGERRGYKNFVLTAKAFSKVRCSHPDLYFVLTGRSLSKAERELFGELGISDYVKVYSDISDTTLAQLYGNAQFFVYPSLYEGFGIPILEAFMQHCPVLLSRASCFPEIGGDAAVYFDTYSEEDELKQMLRLLEDETLRKDIVAKGAERVKLFTWKKTSSQTMETYRKALLEAGAKQLVSKPLSSS